MGFHNLSLFAQAILLRLGFMTSAIPFHILNHCFSINWFTWIPFSLPPHALLKTVEAERISVDHVAHLKPSDGGSAATQCKCFSRLFFALYLYYLSLSLWSRGSVWFLFWLSGNYTYVVFFYWIVYSLSWVWIIGEGCLGQLIANIKFCWIWLKPLKVSVSKAT